MPSWHKWAVPVLSALLLGAMGMRKALIPGPETAEAYHAKVRSAAAPIGLYFGNWQGVDVPLPEAATTLLNPNLTICRNYRNTVTGRRVSLMLIQCRQSRDMDGHYPPNCYPGAGWELQSSAPQTWQLEEMSIPGTEYTFEMVKGGLKTIQRVRSFFVLPDGRMYAEISTFRRGAANFAVRPYGAAQVQVIFPGESLASDRDADFAEFLNLLKPLLRVICSGMKYE